MKFNTLKKLIIKAIVYFGWIKPVDYNLEIADTNHYDTYLYGYRDPVTNRIMSNSFILIKNYTHALYTYILYITTYLNFNLKMDRLGYYTSNYINTYTPDFVHDNSIGYFDIIQEYERYKMIFGDVSDIPLSKIEEALVNLYNNYIFAHIDRFKKDDELSSFITTYNITSYSNTDLYNKFKDALNKFLDDMDKNPEEGE